MSRFLDAAAGSRLRNFFRVLVLLAVGFGLNWSGEQVALVMAALEGGLALVVKDN